MTRPAAGTATSGGGSDWPALAVGTRLIVVKLVPEGHEKARYRGTVIEAGAPHPWVAVETVWTLRPYDLDGLLLLPGDTLYEFFSPVDWFNAFSVFAPDGTLRGWYGNVAYPARLEPTTEPMTLTWHDLYLDVVALPDGTVVVRDEDELAEANLYIADRSLYVRILEAKVELLRRCDARISPFHERPIPTGTDR